MVHWTGLLTKPQSTHHPALAAFAWVPCLSGWLVPFLPVKLPLFMNTMTANDSGSLNTLLEGLDPPGFGTTCRTLYDIPTGPLLPQAPILIFLKIYSWEDFCLEAFLLLHSKSPSSSHNLSLCCRGPMIDSLSTLALWSGWICVNTPAS